MVKQNNVFGIIGIHAIDANWNAGWDRDPKRLPDGRIFGSDKALKYAIRKCWQLQGFPVLMAKSRKITDDGNIIDITLEERYNRLFHQGVKSSTSKEEVLKNLLSTIDARQFGFTFAVQKKDLNATGPVQIGMGRNICDTSLPYTQDILSPFVADRRDKENKDRATNGDLILVDRADYAYPFYITPYALCDGNAFDIEGGRYTEDDYENFKRAAAVCANVVTSCSKAGAQNSYLLTVEAKDEKLFLNNLASYVSLDEDTLVLDSLMGYLEQFKDRIDSVILWYDDTMLQVGDYDGLVKKKLSELQ